MGKGSLIWRTLCVEEISNGIIESGTGHYDRGYPICFSPKSHFDTEKKGDCAGRGKAGMIHRL